MGWLVFSLRISSVFSIVFLGVGFVRHHVFNKEGFRAFKAFDFKRFREASGV